MTDIDGVVLDPLEFAPSRTELDLDDAGVILMAAEWGDADIELFMVKQALGEVPADRHPPNRTVTLTLQVRGDDDVPLPEIAQKLQQKVGIFQREGGWVRRDFNYDDFAVSVAYQVHGAVLRSFSGQTVGAPPSPELVLTCGPYCYGVNEEVLTLYDNDTFAENSIGESRWKFDTGTATLAVSGAELVPSSTAEKRLYRMITASDCVATMKITVGATLTNFRCGPILRRQDASNWLMGWLRQDAANELVIRKYDGAVYTDLAAADYAPSANTAYWIRFAAEGDDLTLTLYDDDPDDGGAVLQTVSHTLTGGDATQFGDGIWGNPGFRFDPDATTARIDDWSLSATAIRSADRVLDVLSDDIAGTAPGLLRAALANRSATSQRSALFAIESRELQSDGLVVRQGENFSLGSGASATQSGASGASTNNVRQVTLSSADTWTGIGLSPDLLFTDRRRVWARFYVNHSASETVSARMRVWPSSYLQGPALVPLIVELSEDDGWTFVDLGEVNPLRVPSGNNMWHIFLDAMCSGGTGATVGADLIVVAPTEQYAVVDFFETSGNPNWDQDLSVEFRSDAIQHQVSENVWISPELPLGDLPYAPPAGLEGRATRFIAFAAKDPIAQNSIDRVGDATDAIDAIELSATYNPGYHFASEAA